MTLGISEESHAELDFSVDKTLREDTIYRMFQDE